MSDATRDPKAEEAPEGAIATAREPADEEPVVPATDNLARKSTLDMLWANVETRWDDDKAHAAFLEFAAAKGDLPEAAGRYREIKDAGGPRSELAQKKLAAIMVIAMQMLASERSDPRTKPPRWLTFLVFCVSVAIVAWVARFVLHR